MLLIAGELIQILLHKINQMRCDYQFISTFSLVLQEGFAIQTNRQFEKECLEYPLRLVKLKSVGINRNSSFYKLFSTSVSDSFFYNFRFGEHWEKNGLINKIYIIDSMWKQIGNGHVSDYRWKILVSLRNHPKLICCGWTGDYDFYFHEIQI